jgi:di/tricarboxylate transporter
MIFAQSINNSTGGVAPGGGWPKAVAMVGVMWLCLVLLIWFIAFAVRFVKTVRIENRREEADARALDRLR